MFIPANDFNLICRFFVSFLSINNLKDTLVGFKINFESKYLIF